MRVGFANGCFACLHEGHKHFLTECRRQCTYLIVAVNSDAYLCRKKGFILETLEIRMHNVSKYAHSVIPFAGREEQLIMEIRPDILFKGYDHSAPDLLAMRQVGWKEHGLWDTVKVIQISHLPGYSTSRILDASESNAPPRA